MKNDLTKGSIGKALVLFTIPLILSGLLQQVFNWVDAFIVGNVEGELALAAIGATGSIYHLFVNVIIGFTSGLSVLAAQQCGMGKKEEAQKALAAFTILLGGVFLAVAAAGFGFCRQILTLLATPQNIFCMAKNYLEILFWGVPCLAVYNTYAAVLRGLGDSRAPFLSVLVSSLANAGLDLLLVAVFRFGTRGAAAATVLSQGAMAVFVVVYAVKKYPYLRFRPQKGMLCASMLPSGFRFGGPPAVQSAASSAGNLVLQRFMNGFGEQTVAAITTAYRVDSVIILPIVNFGSGIATVVAQNIGAQKPARAKQAVKTGAVMISAVSVCLTLFILLAGEFLIAMFGLTDASVAIGKAFFRTIASCYLVYGLAMAVRGYLEGTGDLLFSGAAGIAALLVRIAASYAFAHRFGNMVIGYAEAFSWVVLLLILACRAFARMKKLDGR